MHIPWRSIHPRSTLQAMDDETAEPAGNIRRATSPMLYVSQEVVKEILLRLPVDTLLQFRRVYRAWRHTILDDHSFQHTLLHRHKTDPSLLIALWIHDIDKNYLGGIAASLYKWDGDHLYGATTAFVIIMPVREVPVLAHCWWAPSPQRGCSTPPRTASWHCTAPSAS